MQLIDNIFNGTAFGLVHGPTMKMARQAFSDEGLTSASDEELARALNMYQGGGWGSCLFGKYMQQLIIKEMETR